MSIGIELNFSTILINVFQDIIQNLNNFWSEEGCLIMQPYDTEKELEQ